MARKELTQEEIIAVIKLERAANISVFRISTESNMWGINWPGKGTKTVKETREFIILLSKAVKLANRINRRKW